MARAQWEEAKSEFFQETYPCENKSIASSADIQSSTLLYSTQTDNANNAQYSIFKNTSKLHTSKTKTKSRMKAAVQGLEQEDSEGEGEVVDFADENIATEEEIWEEIYKIKDMTIALRQKRIIKAQFEKSPRIKVGHATALRHTCWSGFKRLPRLLCCVATPFRAMLRPWPWIERQWGSNVSTSFLTLQYTFLFNVLVSCYFCLVFLLPTTTMSGPAPHPMFTSTYNVSGHDTVIVVQKLLHDVKLHVESTPIFYGFYRNATIFLPLDLFRFQLPSLYLFTFISLYFLCFIYFLHKLAVILKHGAYRRSPYSWFNFIFSFWNFGANSTPDVQEAKEIFYRYFKARLLRERKLKTPRMCCNAFCKYLLRFFVLLCFLTLLCIIIFVLLCLLDSSLLSGFLNLLDGRMDSTSNQDYLSPLLIACFLPCLFATLPRIFRFVSSCEDFSPEITSSWYAVRVLLLRLLPIVTIIAFKLYSQYTAHHKHNVCREDDIGILFLLIVILDFVFFFIKVFFIQFPVTMFSSVCCRMCCRGNGRCCCNRKSAFCIFDNLEESVYSFSLCCFGMFFAPFLPAVLAVKTLFMFAITLFHIKVNCLTTFEIASPSLFKTLYGFFCALGFLLAVTANVFYIGFVSPSSQCGPFDNGQPIIQLIWDTWESMPEWIHRIHEDVFEFALMGKLGVALFACYVYRIRLQSAKETNASLRDQLVSQGEDKTYMIHRIKNYMKKNNEHASGYNTK